MEISLLNNNSGNSSSITSLNASAVAVLLLIPRLQVSVPGQAEKFATAIGVGECAGVMIDLVATLILEAEEKIGSATECLDVSAWADAIYHAYAAQVHTAKALLLQEGVHCNTQSGILRDFDIHFTDQGFYTEQSGAGFRESVMRMNDTAASELFAKNYLDQAIGFIEYAKKFREQSNRP